MLHSIEWKDKRRNATKKKISSNTSTFKKQQRKHTGFNCFVRIESTLLLDYYVLARLFFLSWGEIKLQLILKGGKTVRQYIKSHMNGGRQGYVGRCRITEVVKGSIHNWNPSHKRLSGLGDSDTETDSKGTKKCSEEAQNNFIGCVLSTPGSTYHLKASET